MLKAERRAIVHTALSQLQAPCALENIKSIEQLLINTKTHLRYTHTHTHTAYNQLLIASKSNLSELITVGLK